MKARRLIENSAFSPETLHIIFKAFDDAWNEIAHHFDGDAEGARMKLAHALLMVAREDSEDADRLKNGALQMMALAYRERAGTTG